MSGPENKFHARKSLKIPYVAEPFFFFQKSCYYYFLCRHILWLPKTRIPFIGETSMEGKYIIPFHSLLYSISYIEGSLTRRKNQYIIMIIMNVLSFVIWCPIILGTSHRVIHSVYNSRTTPPSNCD